MTIRITDDTELEKKINQAIFDILKMMHDRKFTNIEAYFICQYSARQILDKECVA